MRNSRRAGKPAGRKPEKQGLTGLFTKGKNIPTTAQQTLPYREMYRDGVCRVADRYYTKTIEYEDINYQLAQSEDQAAIFDGWSACLNYFDSSLPFQLSFLNHRSRPGSRYLYLLSETALEMDVVVIGDSLNDVGMIRRFKGYTLEHAGEEVRLQAAHVCRDVAACIEQETEYGI